ncbi:hypothetical protein ABCR94_12045 [Streptomyces sp. 21So2-11]|uniref:hypothetical protein n=1 Tax=Streptomyces sp. 21So2-11 TaxID=3144408 RepID=UPI00321A1128
MGQACWNRSAREGASDVVEDVRPVIGLRELFQADPSTTAWPIFSEFSLEKFGTFLASW